MKLTFLLVSLSALMALNSLHANGSQQSSPATISGSFQPGRQKPITYADSDVDVRLMTGQEFDSLSIKYKEGHNQSESIVPLPAELAQVNTITRSSNGLLVVIGMVNGSGFEVVILSPTTDKVTDKFVCYKPSISPDRRFIVFIKFYPSHFVDGVDDHCMLYDIEKTARMNRPATVDVHDWKNVGITLYPAGIGNHDNDNVMRPAGSTHRIVSRSLFWSPDSGQLVFADETASIQLKLISINSAAGGQHSIKKLDIPLEKVCTSGRPCSASLESVEFGTSPDSRIETDFRNFEGGLHRLYFEESDLISSPQ